MTRQEWGVWLAEALPFALGFGLALLLALAVVLNVANLFDTPLPEWLGR